MTGDNLTVERDEAQKVDLLAGMTLHPLPVLTIAAILIPGIFLVAFEIWPGVLDALQRDRAALEAGQWWRILSPLLVDSDGWLQFAFNSLGFACVGLPAEHLLGRWRWAALFLAGGLVGEITGYAWEPTGGGTSIALCGLIGGLLVWRLRRGAPLLPLASLYSLWFAAALALEAVVALFTASMIARSIAVVVACAIVTNVFAQLVQRRASVRTVVLVVLAVVLAGAVVVTVLRNHHGPSLLAGMVTGLLLIWLDGGQPDHGGRPAG